MDSSTLIITLLFGAVIIGCIFVMAKSGMELFTMSKDQENEKTTNQNNMTEYLKKHKIPPYANKLLTSKFESYCTDGYGKYIWDTHSDGYMMANTYDNSLDGEIPQLEKIKVEYYDLTGDVHTSVSGGGSSLKGAVVGGILAGGAGAVIGSRKKTTTEIKDDRKTVFVYRSEGYSHNTPQTVLFLPEAHIQLMTLFPDKNYKYLK